MSSVRRSLAETHPELASQANGWDPATVVAGSGRKLSWRCEHGHTWNAVVTNRVRGTGCPTCSGRIPSSGMNDLATTNPELAAQADGWDPTAVLAFSHRKMNWKCDLGHQWAASVADRSSGRGCPFCANRRVLVGFNDLATTNPELASQADGWDPTTVVAFSNRKVQWKCSKGHTWRAWIGNRTKGSGCPVCSGRTASSGFNDLATTHPELAAQADGWDPTTVVAGSDMKLPWKCELDHCWIARVGERSSGQGCPYCANRSVLSGFNDLATTNPELAAQADGWDPTTIFANTSAKLTWRCPEGHVWESSANNRSQGKSCPVCAVHGFNPGKDGWLYFLLHDDFGLFQIGITNVPENRIGKHLGRGWTILDVRGPMDGFLTRDLETAILRAVERRGGIRAHKSGHIKFDGYSESWTQSSLSAQSLKELINWVYEDQD